MIAGLAVIVAGGATASLPALDHPAKTPLSFTLAQEGRSITVSGKVERLLESGDRIGVAIAPYAQLFFIARSDQNFEKWLALLKQAKAGNQPVKCTVRAYSGRIERVAVQR